MNSYNLLIIIILTSNFFFIYLSIRLYKTVCFWRGAYSISIDSCDLLLKDIHESVIDLAKDREIDLGWVPFILLNETDLKNLGSDLEARKETAGYKFNKIIADTKKACINRKYSWLSNHDVMFYLGMR